MTRQFFRTFLLSAGGAVFLASAVPASGQAEIRKVNYIDLTFERLLDTSDPMILFERQRLLYGAITADEYRQRRGRYYTVLWRSEDLTPGVVVRLEYLQANTGSTVHVLEVVPEKVERRNATYLEITGHKFTGEWKWPDGTPLSDQEYDLYMRRLRSGEQVPQRAEPSGGGPILAWRLSLLRDGVVLDTNRSFLWRD